MYFHQFVSAEGNALKVLAIAAAAGSGHSCSIQKDVQELKGTKHCAKVKSKYRQFSRCHHPDTGGKASDFVKLVVAHDNALAVCMKNDRPRQPSHATKKGNKKRKGHHSHKKRDYDKRERKRKHKQKKKRHEREKKEKQERKRKHKQRKKRQENEREKEEETEQDYSLPVLLAAVVGVGAAILKKKYSRTTQNSHTTPRLVRQRSEEAYRRATGHEKRR